MTRPGRERVDSGRFDHRRTGSKSDKRHHLPPRHSPHRAPRSPHREVKPMPLGDRCNPACPLFRCANNALMLKLENGKVVAHCSWAGDQCIVTACQYASCIAKNMLPDGRCLHALREREQKRIGSFEEEIEKELQSTRVRGLLSRRGLGKDLENELF